MLKRLKTLANETGPWKDGEYFESSFVGTTFDNGGKATGHIMVEDGVRWFQGVDKDGFEYETQEMPCLRINLVGVEGLYAA